MRGKTEGMIMEEHVGFRPSMGCIEKLFVLQKLIVKLEREKKLYAAFLDLEKAYDRVWRPELWKALAQYKVQGRLLRAVQGLYQDSEAAVRVEDVMTDWFEDRGVRCHHVSSTST